LAKAPDAFRTISEAAEELDLPQHVLRFWETRFTQIKPLKRGGGRRYYRPDDVLLLKGIRHLLYDQGFTIKGVQRILKQEGPRHVIDVGDAGGLAAPPTTAGSVAETPKIGEPGGTQGGERLSPGDRKRLDNVLRDLLECKRLLDIAREG